MITCAVWMHPSPTPSCTCLCCLSPSSLLPSVWPLLSFAPSRSPSLDTCASLLVWQLKTPLCWWLFSLSSWQRGSKWRWCHWHSEKAIGDWVRNRETSVQKKRTKQLLAARDDDERQLESRSCDLWLRKGARAGGELRSRACRDSLARLCECVRLCLTLKILNLTWILFTCVVNYNICNILR